MTSNSYLKDIRKQLIAGKMITVQSVRRSVGTQELRHYISILRKQLDIQTEWVSRNGKRFKRYWLEQKQEAA